MVPAVSEMRIELISGTDQLKGSDYYEFMPGEFRDRYWGHDSVYLEGDAFAFIEGVFFEAIRDFAPFGWTTISGLRIRNLCAGLEGFAALVTRSHGPDMVWDRVRMPPPVHGIDDWGEAKRHLSLMSRDLSRWMLTVESNRQPVTIIGL